MLLRTLNLGGIRAQSRTPLLLELARIERAAKHARRIERLREQSELLPEKTYRSLELNRFDAATRMQIERLRDGNFFTETINVIAIGRPGAGKSHFVCASAMRWSSRDIRCCSHPPAHWYSGGWPPSAICAYRRNWPSSIDSSA